MIFYNIFKFFFKFKNVKDLEKPLNEINPQDLEKPLNEINPQDLEKPPIAINQEEFIMISEHLMRSYNTTHKLLGIIMASGIPLSDLKNTNIQTPYNFKSNIMCYTLGNGLMLKTYSLADPNTIAKYIQNINKSELIAIDSRKISKVAKKIFGPNVNTRKLKIAYSLIVKSKERKKARKKYTKNTGNILLTETPSILDIDEKLDYIKSFAPIKPHQGNLEHYKNSMHKNTYTIANLIANFFSENEPHKNLHNLKLYINANLRKLGIYKNTSTLQNRIYKKIFFLE